MENCIQCGETLRGRSHRKFCSDQCRAAHHNTIHQKEWNELRAFARNIFNNAKRLHQLQKNKKSYSLTQLQALGVNPYCCMEWCPTHHGVSLRYANIWLHTSDGWNFSFSE